MSEPRIIKLVQHNPLFNIPLSMEEYKKRVAAYARVSTDDKEQLTSYMAQIKYYTQTIKEREDWEFVGMYADRDRSGTTTKHREGFNRMIQDAMNGKIDLIVTNAVIMEGRVFWISTLGLVA